MIFVISVSLWRFAFDLIDVNRRSSAAESCSSWRSWRAWRFNYCLGFLGVLGVLAANFRLFLRVYGFLTLIAVSIPCMIASGVGGQPGTATSTGITFDTRPQLA